MPLTTTSLKSLIAACCMFGFVLAQPALGDTLAPVSPPVPMPVFKLPGLNGTSGSDADLRNKVTVIRFWASW
ncbi:MAG: hypothetical protein K2X06_11590 [Burkholderiales bacterium]|nr:hypothetical protein [Burkholderiales bacterium]